MREKEKDRERGRKVSNDGFSRNLHSKTLFIELTKRFAKWLIDIQTQAVILSLIKDWIGLIAKENCLHLNRVPHLKMLIMLSKNTFSSRHSRWSWGGFIYLAIRISLSNRKSITFSTQKWFFPSEKYLIFWLKIAI